MVKDWAMASAPNARLWMAQWVAGELPPESVPTRACDALAAGCDTPSLRQLAGIVATERADVEPFVGRLLAELGERLPSHDEALLVLIEAMLTLIADTTIEPYVGAKAIWRHADDLGWSRKSEWQQLSAFIGLASEWEDHSEHRPDCEAAILDEARTLAGSPLPRGG
jgi:hypothetical protein